MFRRSAVVLDTMNRNTTTTSAVVSSDEISAPPEAGIADADATIDDVRRRTLVVDMARR
jgi:hypothetical protein